MSYLFKYKTHRGYDANVERQDEFRGGYWMCTAKGTPVHINEHGVVDMGAGGVFNGQEMCSHKLAKNWGYSDDECPLCGQKVAGNETMFNNAFRYNHRPLTVISQEDVDNRDIDLEIINSPRNILKFLTQHEIWGTIKTALRDMDSEFDTDYKIFKGDKYFACNSDGGEKPYSLKLIVEYAALPDSYKSRNQVLKEIVANNEHDYINELDTETDM